MKLEFLPCHVYTNWYVFMFWFIHVKKDENKSAYLYEKLFLTRFSDHLKISI